MKRVLSLAAFLPLLLSCAVVDENAPVPVSEKVSIVLFSTPWCEPCEHMLPAIDSKLNSDLGDSVDRVETSVFVVTGKKAAQPPTQEIADEYKKKLGVSFKMRPDPWKWTNYKKYFQTTALIVPAVVVLDGEGNALRAFDPGTFTADEVVAYLQSVLK